MDLQSLLPHLLALLLLAGLALAYERAPDRPAGVPRVKFHVGLLVLAIALVGPLRLLAERALFSMHAVQFILLTLVGAPLLIRGITAAMAERRATAVARALTKPARCFILFNLVLMATHLPPVYALGLRSAAVQSVLYLLAVGSGVLMWWPLMSPTPRLPRLSYPMQMLYCFAMSIPLSIVSVYIVAARTVIYPYPGGTLDDQRLGGLIMWVPSGLFFYGVLSVVFWKWQSRAGDAPPELRVPDARPIPQ